MSEDVKTDIKRFFAILDQKEEFDSGNIFNPVYISSCRVMLTEELEAIFKRLKRYAND